MSPRTLTFRYVDVLPMLGSALIAAGLRLVSIEVRESLAGAALTVTGYLRRRPDPAIEHMLRVAFTGLDRDLAEILGDRTPRGLRNLAKPQETTIPGTFPT